MAVYRCYATGSSGTMVDVDQAAPGQYGGQTLTCQIGTDNFGDPKYGPVAFAVVEPPPEPEPPAEVSPEVQRVADFLGQGDNPELVALAGEHVVVITAMARAYTRGAGFYGDMPEPDVEAVVTTATARLVANPEQIRYGVGSTQYFGGFTGWSLAELAVLNRYRRRAL